MTPNATRIAAAALCVVACGGSGDVDEVAFPTRDWSGSYVLRAEKATTDCAGVESAPPLGDVILELRQSRDNDAAVLIGPFVALGGRFDGDELAALGTITEPVPLPDSLLDRASEADSLETIAYALDASFDGQGALRGRYRIRAPDLVALARGTGPGRCEVVYEVRGSSAVTAPSEGRR